MLHTLESYFFVISNKMLVENCDQVSFIEMRIQNKPLLN